MVTKDVISVQEAGQRLGIGRCNAYKYAALGIIPVFRLGKKMVVPIKAFERMLESGKLPENSNHSNCGCMQAVKAGPESFEVN